MNPLSLVQIAMVVLERFEKAEDGLAFLEKVGDKVKENDEAAALVKIMIGKIKLHKVPKTHKLIYRLISGGNTKRGG